MKISILYPGRPGARFDFEYYTRTHMPRAIELLSAHPGFRGALVERGIGGAAPGAEPHYVAKCHFHFGSADEFLQAFTPNAAELQADMPNYTDIEPVIRINEVLMAAP